ncbi:MAG TPA: hypothetical protein VIK31_04360 [Propionibacteriaceae bacterium]
MTTTTQTPMTSAAMQSLDPDAVRALTSLKAACKACEDADNSQAKKGAEEAGDKYDGACQDDAKRRFLAQGKAIVDDMWATFNTLQDGYQSSLRPHENVGPRLHQVYTDTWVVVGQKIAPIASDVQTRGQQDHWTGAGADDYMKQLPVQLAALNEFSQYVAVAGAGVETPAQLQQAVFTAFVTMAGGAAQKVQGYAGTDTSDHYFQRCAWAANTLSQCVDWFTNNLMTGTGTWQGALDDHIQQMTSTSVTNAAVLTGDSWPKATKTTDTSKLPTGTDPKYTVPSAVGSVGTEGPITDRGDSSGVSVDDAAPQSPGGYA